MAAKHVLPYEGATQPHQIANPWDGPAMLGACGLIPSGVETLIIGQSERPKTAPYPTLLI